MKFDWFIIGLWHILNNYMNCELADSKPDILYYLFVQLMTAIMIKTFYSPSHKPKPDNDNERDWREDEINLNSNTNIIKTKTIYVFISCEEPWKNWW